MLKSSRECYTHDFKYAFISDGDTQQRITLWT